MINPQESMSQSPNKITQFWQELKRRRVIHVIIVYASVSFVIIEMVNNVYETLRLPDWTPALTLIILAIGFPLAIIFSWIFDVTPEGIEKTKPSKEISKGEKALVPNSWRIATYVSVVVIIGLIVLNVIPKNKRSEVKEILDKSIAVLPFNNDSPEQEMYFINGTMEEILDNLCKIKDLRVISRNSVEQYRNNPKPTPVIAEEMNVSYVLEGSGQRDGNNIRLTVQLLDARNDSHVWSESYYREIENIFELQSEIAQSIAGEIKAIVTSKEKQLIEKIPTANLTAYDFYQKGEEERRKHDSLALERAEDLYRYALEEDSTFALAYLGLAKVYWDKNYWEEFLQEDFLDSALNLIDIALSFDDQLADAYILKGNYYRLHNKHEHAITEYDKAIKYNPNDGRAYLNKGQLYLHVDLVKTIDNFEKAVSLQKGSPWIYRHLRYAYALAGFQEKAIYYNEEKLKLDNDSAQYYSFLGEIEESTGNFKKAIEFGEKSYAIDSTDDWLIFLLGIEYMYLGQYEKSLDYIRKYQERIKVLDDPDPWGTIWVGYVYWINGLKDEAENYFNTALEFYNELIQLDRFLFQDLHTYFSIAALHAFLEDKDKAYEYLKLMNQRLGMPIWVIKDIKNDPHFDSIREEPEFQQIVRDVEAKYQAEHERVRQWLEENDML